MLRRHRRVGLLFLLPMLAHAGAAYGASTAASPGDPPAGSPSGAIYQLPLEKGRADAAPKGSGGTGAPAGVPPGGGSGGSGGAGQAGSDGAAEGSFYRSENNFGSSSKVPGVSANDGGGESGSGRGTTTSGEPGTTASGEDGSGSGTFGSAGAASHITDSGNTSSAANILLLVAVGLIAIGVAIAGARANRLKSQQPSRPAS
jgi:hypothetical protein